MRDYVMIGSSPCDEDCAQIGSPRYHELSKIELAQFKAAIIQKMGEPPEGCSLVVKEGEIACVYDTDNEKACAYAFACEDGSPATWEEVGMKAPRLDDDDFAATELLPTPNATATDEEKEMIKRGFLKPGHILESGAKVEKPLKKHFGPPEKCDLHGSQFAASQCLGKIGNEFMDGSIPAVGSWGNVCPACFGHNRMGLGEGRGQRYKKAADGNFYKVEG
jgi:hypothetical protein